MTRPLRSDGTESRSDLLSSLLCRPERITQASALSAPMNIPGKSPAKKTPAGNLLHLAAGSDLFELIPAEAAAVVGDVVGDAVEEEVEVGCAIETVVCAADTEALVAPL